jgi:dTDP-D-glucose 4,6-dehydratase
MQVEQLHTAEVVAIEARWCWRPARGEPGRSYWVRCHGEWTKGRVVEAICLLLDQQRHSFEEGLAATVRWYRANQAWVETMRSRSGNGGQCL